MLLRLLFVWLPPTSSSSAGFPKCGQCRSLMRKKVIFEVPSAFWDPRNLEKISFMLTTSYNVRKRKTSRNLQCTIIKKRTLTCSSILGHVILQNIIFSYKFIEHFLTEFCQNLSVEFINVYLAIIINVLQIHSLMYCKYIINTNYLHEDF